MPEYIIKLIFRIILYPGAEENKSGVDIQIKAFQFRIA